MAETYMVMSSTENHLNTKGNNDIFPKWQIKINALDSALDQSALDAWLGTKVKGATTDVHTSLISNM